VGVDYRNGPKNLSTKGIGTYRSSSRERHWNQLLAIWHGTCDLKWCVELKRKLPQPIQIRE
jgi:hypothetical protein